MRCPIDNTIMQIAERSGAEIDYCPDCRGIWLDRGELDKLIERDATLRPPTSASPPDATPGKVGPGRDSSLGRDAAPAAPPSIGSAAMDALRAVRELADNHKRKGGGFRRL